MGARSGEHGDYAAPWGTDQTPIFETSHDSPPFPHATMQRSGLRYNGKSDARRERASTSPVVPLRSFSQNSTEGRLNHLALDAGDLQVSSQLMANTQTRRALALVLVASWPRMLALAAVIASAGVFG